MNLRVAHNGEDREMDVIEDGTEVRHCRAKASEVPSLVAAGQRVDGWLPCMMALGHQGPHWSSSGCAGSQVYWSDDEDEVQPEAESRTAAMTASLQRAIQRDPNPRGTWKRATLSNDGVSLVTEHDGRTYVLTVREV